MTDRLTPVGSRGGAEAVLVGMFVQITHDDVIGDVAGRGREVASLPEALSPVALTDMFEFLLDLARGPALGPAHKVADRDMWRDFDEHMHMVARKGTVDDGHAHLGADLPNDLAHPEANFPLEHLEPVLGRPDEMVAMMKCRVTAGRISHSWYPREK